MNCAKARDLVGMYLDGELRPRQREAVREHLAGCESCRAELESVSSLSSRLVGMPVCEPNESFYRRLFQRLWEERPAAQPGARYVWQAAVAAAAMLALFFTLRPPLAPVEQAAAPVMGTSTPQIASAPSQTPAAAPPAGQQPPAQASPAGREADAPAAVAAGAPAAAAQPRRARKARRVHPAERPGPAEPIAVAQPQGPTPEQVAAVADALLRLTTAAQETGSALHKAVALQAKRQRAASETLETAFSSFVSSPALTREVPEGHEL